MTKWCVPGEC